MNHYPILFCSADDPEMKKGTSPQVRKKLQVTDKNGEELLKQSPFPMELSIHVGHGLFGMSFSLGFLREFSSPCKHWDRTGHGADEREIWARGSGLEDPTGD